MIATLCLLVISQTEVLSGPGAWFTKLPAPISSKEWIAEKAATAKAVAALKADSSERRLQKLKIHWDKLSIYDVEPKDAYRATIYGETFKSELGKLRVRGAFLTATADSRGSTDPEYMRVGYTALSSAQNPKKWPGLGIRLMKLYPDDKRLRRAFLIDCAVGILPFEEVQIGLNLIEADFRTNKMREIDYFHFKAGMLHKLYNRSNKMPYLDQAIIYYEKYADVETNKERSSFTRQLIAALKDLRIKRQKQK